MDMNSDSYERIRFSDIHLNLFSFNKNLLKFSYKIFTMVIKLLTSFLRLLIQTKQVHIRLYMIYGIREHQEKMVNPGLYIVYDIFPFNISICNLYVLICLLL